MRVMRVSFLEEWVQEVGSEGSTGRPGGKSDTPAFCPRHRCPLGQCVLEACQC